MKRDEALQHCDAALKELADSLRQGKSQSLLRYLAFMARFHQYSFGNCLLIALQRPEATLVAGFQRWKQLGRTVRRNERGIALLAPMIGRRQPTDSESEDDSSAETAAHTSRSGSTIRGFRIVYVFDVSQTEGRELASFAQLSGDPGDHIPKLEQLIAARGIQLEYVTSVLQGANGASFGGRIQISLQLPPPQQFSTLVHELAHELLHHGPQREQLSKAVRETEAESVAYVVCRAIGLECSTRAADYIQLWSGSEQTLQESLDRIRAVARDLLQELGVAHTSAIPQPNLPAAALPAPAAAAVTRTPRTTGSPLLPVGVAADQVAEGSFV
jgi:antirestriction protein ArdC